MSKRPAKKKQNLHAKETLQIFWQTMVRHRKESWLALLYPAGMVILGVAVPFYIGRILANIQVPEADMNTYLIMLSVVCLVGVIFSRIGIVNLFGLHAKTMSDLQHRALEALLRRSVGFHNDRVSGKLVSDAIDLPQSFSHLMTAAYMGGLTLFLTLLVGLTVVFVNSWILGLALLCIVTTILAWAYIESGTRSALRTQRLVATKKVTAHLSDAIVNAQTVKAFARETHEIEHNHRLNISLRDMRITDWIRAARSGNNRIAVLLAFQLGLIILIITMVRDNPGLLGVGIFAFTYTFLLTQRLFEINTITRQVEEALLNASPMTKVLLEDIEIGDVPGAKDLRITKGAIDLEDVRFKYDGNMNDNDVFNGLSLRVAPGEKIGLVGPSGGGKSTLTRLLLRFEDIAGGRILFDGQDISRVTQASLREQISYVPQEPLLFHRTVRENIAYGRPEATENEVIAAAKQAHAHDFITQLPQGYGTIVGERGVKLSGGQRQRIAIARAILKNAPILVLDEATSALDSESEVLVQKALWQLMEGRTAIVIAHRLSTIQKMDRIIVLQDGQIVEEGAHRQLVKRGGLYAKLWGHQSGGFVQDDEKNQPA